MTARTVITGFGYLMGLVLLGYGVWFFLAPDTALLGTYHLADRLPLVMGGRYMFFGALLIAALIHGDAKVLAFLLAGFAGLAAIDTVIYFNTAPIPHLAVGVTAAAAGLYFFKTKAGAG